MDRLPVEVLHNIMCFVGDSRNLLSCERTCRVFRRVLKNDAVWGHCEECKPKYDPMLQSKPSSSREKVFIVRALNQCHHWQRTTTPVLLTVLGFRKWKLIVDYSISWGLPTDLARCRHKFPLRGDTSAVLMEIVERCLVTQLVRAEKLAGYSARRTGKDRSSEILLQPTVGVADFVVQDAMYKFCDQVEQYNLVPNPEGRLPALPAIFFISDEQKNRVVRGLAYKAGIVKLDGDLYELVWKTIFKVITLLLKPACMVLADREPPTAGEKRILHVGKRESIRDISPLPEIGQADGCTNCHKQEMIHWIVPKQVEEAAKQLGIGSSVYGDDWHIDELDLTLNPSGRDQEVAESKYSLVDWDDAGAVIDRTLGAQERPRKLHATQYTAPAVRPDTVHNNEDQPAEARDEIPPTIHRMEAPNIGPNDNQGGSEDDESYVDDEFSDEEDLDLEDSNVDEGDVGADLSGEEDEAGLEEDSSVESDGSGVTGGEDDDDEEELSEDSNGTDTSTTEDDDTSYADDGGDETDDDLDFLADTSANEVSLWDNFGNLCFRDYGTYADPNFARGYNPHNM